MSGEIKNGLFVNKTPVDQRIASLGQIGLPIGPVLPVSGGDPKADLKNQIEKNKETKVEGKDQSS